MSQNLLNSQCPRCHHNCSEQHEGIFICHNFTVLNKPLKWKMEDLTKFRVYKQNTNELVGQFTSRIDAVYWCKVNQISSIPDGEWEDDFFIQEPGKAKDYY